MPSAGDLERFTYCAHNWELARQGIDHQTEGSKRGIQQHAEKGKAIDTIDRRHEEKRRAWAWAFRGLLALASVVTLALEVVYFQATAQGIILIVTALILVSAIVGLILIARIQENQARQLQQKGGVARGRVVASDLQGAGQLIEDPKTGLRGTPDYVMETEAGLVPVEVKTGATPTRPFDSHVMQIAAYMHLLEVATKQPPAYGLITYPSRIFQVDWNDATKEKLAAKLAELTAAEAAGKADRDHKHVGRCKGCSRRAECTQSLA